MPQNKVQVKSFHSLFSLFLFSVKPAIFFTYSMFLLLIILSRVQQVCFASATGSQWASQMRRFNPLILVGLKEEREMRKVEEMRLEAGNALVGLNKPLTQDFLS